LILKCGSRLPHSKKEVCMKKTMIVLGCLVCALVFQSCAKRQAAPESLRLDTGWKFQYGDDLKWLDPGFDDSAWKTIRPDRLWES
jgi:hypothetical protein